MDIQRALAGISVYNSMATYPLLCLKGFSIYLQGSKDLEQLERMQKYFREFIEQFADVVLGYASGDDKVMLINVSVYDGIAAIAKNNQTEFKELVPKIQDLKQIVTQILRSENPHPERVKSFVALLMSMLELSERTIPRTAYESFLLGHPAVNY